MRYVIATVGAILIFVGAFIVCVFACTFLPGDINHRYITFSYGIFSLWATPSVLIGVPVATAAAIHSFRSTLRRYAAKDQPQPPEPS